MPHPHPAFTAHARLRLAQRGVSLDAIDATLAWGRSFFARGVEVFRLDRRAVEGARDRGV